MKYPEFVENSIFFSMDDSCSAEQQLQAIAENVKKIHALTAKEYDSLEVLIQYYLKAGLEIFGMETGIVSRIEDDIYTVKDVISPLDAIHPQDKFALEDTYCREVFESRQVIGFPDVGAHVEMCKHPVYQNLRLESYISAPIWVYGELYGTLNFTSREKRQHGFSEHEKDLIEMMAASIGNFILLQQKEKDLLALNDGLKVFVGHVSHDLRNPLGAIKTMSQMAVRRVAKRGDDKDEKIQSLLQRISASADTCIELVSSILDIAALGTGKIIPNIHPFEFRGIIQNAEELTEHMFDAAGMNVYVNAPDTCVILGDENRLLQVFVNLLNNAAKYGESGSEVTVTAIANGEQLDITVSNLIAEGGKSLEEFSPSIGFGLDIVTDILKAHEVDFYSSTDENRFIARFSLPLASRAQN